MLFNELKRLPRRLYTYRRRSILDSRIRFIPIQLQFVRDELVYLQVNLITARYYSIKKKMSLMKNNSRCDLQILDKVAPPSSKVVSADGRSDRSTIAIYRSV